MTQQAEQTQTGKPRSLLLANQLHENQDQQRALQLAEATLKAELALAMLEEGVDQTVGDYGQTYQLARPNARYVFDIPDEEYDRLGIREACTPVAKPKLTKALLDKLLKKCQLDDITVAEWQTNGWYQVERSGEITIKQVTTKMDDLRSAVGF